MKTKSAASARKKPQAAKLVKEQVAPDQRLALADQQAHLLIAQAIDKNVPVETMEKLFAMRRELKAEWSRERYYVALAAFQLDCPIIKKTKVVYNKPPNQDKERYRYAPLDSIIRQVKQPLEKHGFSYRTDAGIEGQFVTGTTIATHRDGHSERSSFTVPVNKDAFMTTQQQFAAALMFTKRYSFVDVFGILTSDEDYDGNITTIKPLSKEQEHKRTKAYEEVTGEGDKAVEADRTAVAAFLNDNMIPDGFVLRMLLDKKIIKGHTTTIAGLKPGVLARLLDPKSKANLIKAWAAHQKDESPTERELRQDAESKSKDKGRVVTNEGDQTRTDSILRQPIMTDIPSVDLLTQEGFNDWREVKIHWGEQQGTPLGKVTRKSLLWWITSWHPKKWKGAWQPKDITLDAALVMASAELAGGKVK